MQRLLLLLIAVGCVSAQITSFSLSPTNIDLNSGAAVVVSISCISTNYLFRRKSNFFLVEDAAKPVQRIAVYIAENGGSAKLRYRVLTNN